MFLCLSIVIIALIWLLIETDFMSVRLPVGKTKTQGILLLQAAKVQPILLLNRANEFAYELANERIEYAKNQAELNLHNCPVCKKYFDIYVKTRTFTIGNSTFTITGCPTCVEDYRSTIEKIQTTKHKPSQLVKAPCNTQITLANLDSWGKPIKDKDAQTYGLVSKEWLEQHINDEYPEPLIEISVDNGQSLHVNGNYKKGLIGDFIDQYKAPKKVKVK